MANERNTLTDDELIADFVGGTHWRLKSWFFGIKTRYINIYW